MDDSIRKPILSLHRHSRRISSSSKGEQSGRRESLGSVDYRAITLESNHIIVEDQPMGEESWYRLAFALGMPSSDTRCPSPAAREFAQQVQSRRSISCKDMRDLLVSLLVSVARNHQTMKCRTDTLFHHDGVPDEVPDFEADAGWKMHLPTPGLPSLWATRDTSSMHTNWSCKRDSFRTITMNLAAYTGFLSPWLMYFGRSSWLKFWGSP